MIASFSAPVTEQPKPDVLVLAQFQADFASDSLIVQAISDAGLTFEARLWGDLNYNVPTSLPYKAIILADPGGNCCQLSDDKLRLRNYLSSGGGIVPIAGSIFQIGLTPDDQVWLGASSLGYTATETATVSSDHPLGTALLAGDVLKVMPSGEVGAQWVDSLATTAQRVASWSGGQVFAYFFQGAGGRVYYQADRSSELAGQDGYNRLRSLLSAGVRFVAQSQPIATTTPAQTSTVQTSYSTTTVTTVYTIGTTTTITTLTLATPTTNPSPETFLGLTGTEWTAVGTIIALISLLVAGIRWPKKH